MRREFNELFDLRKSGLFTKIDIIINGHQYHTGDIIETTDLGSFDLLDNPQNYFLITKTSKAGILLDGRATKK